MARLPYQVGLSTSIFPILFPAKTAPIFHKSIFLMKLTHNYYVYILKCSDDSYYVGVTNNLERRLWEHNEGLNNNCYTYNKRPVALMYNEPYIDITQAIQREKQLKGWSRNKKKALFNLDWDQIRQLARSKSKS